jgi:5-methylcytosine-specific restriction protein A
MALKRTPMKSRYRGTGPAPDVVDLVYDRAAHSCELCLVAVGPGRGDDHELHHRRPRRMGGSLLPDTNLPPNLLLLCPDCHSTVERERAAAYEGGWLVRQGDNPALVPVLIGAQRWVLLTVSGQYKTIEVVT